MSVKKRQLATILSGFCLLFLLVGSGFSQTEPRAQLSFGRVMPDQPVEQVIAFSNPTGQNLKIANILLTPPLLAKDISPVIPPNENGQFTLVLGKDRQFGSFEGLIKINFEGNVVDSIVFKVEGYIIPPVEFKPYAAFYIATHSGKEKEAYIEIINHRDQPLNLTDAVSNSDRFSISLKTIKEGQRYRLNLLLNGNAKPGEKSEEIILLADPPTETPLLVQANTIIRAPVYTFPETVDMGALPLKVAIDSETGTKLAQTLMVYRPGTTDFQIEASVDLKYLTVKSERGPDGDRYQLTLTLIPGEIVPGKIEGKVKIKTNDKEFSELEIPITGVILD